MMFFFFCKQIFLEMYAILIPENAALVIANNSYNDTNMNWTSAPIFIVVTLLAAPTAHSREAIIINGDTLALDGTTFRLHVIGAPKPARSA